MSSENSVFLEQEKETSALLNDILSQLTKIPNANCVVNSINNLKSICVPMTGAKTIDLGYPSQSNGVQGFVPAPSIAEADKFLRGDGTWQRVITSIDPLKTEPLNYAANVHNAEAYMYMQPSTDTSGYVGTLKYSTNLKFGRRDITIGSDISPYTLLDIKQDDASVDVALKFTASNISSNRGSVTLFANLTNSHLRVKMPQVSGTLLTDSGFAVNGNVDILSDSNSLFVGPDEQGIRVYSGIGNYGSRIKFGSRKSTGTSDESTWFISADSQRFKIAWKNIASANSANNKGAFWIENNAEEDYAVWRLQRNLKVSDSIESQSIICNNADVTEINVSGYRTYIGSDSQVHHSIGISKIVYNTPLSQVNLINDRNSLFHVDEFYIVPMNYSGSASNEGGQIRLAQRANQSYGDICIDNYGGQCRIWNDISEATRGRILTIDGTSDTATVNATAFAVKAQSLMSTSGVVNMSSDGGTRLQSNGTQIYSTKPMSTTAETPIGGYNAYYRRIYISDTEPGSNVGNNGDVWIQY